MPESEFRAPTMRARPAERVDPRLGCVDDHVVFTRTVDTAQRVSLVPVRPLQHAPSRGGLLGDWLLQSCTRQSGIDWDGRPKTIKNQYVGGVCRATNQGVVGSNPASRTINSSQINGLASQELTRFSLLRDFLRDFSVPLTR
jgi:hypothetical protein